MISNCSGIVIISSVMVIAFCVVMACCKVGTHCRPVLRVAKRDSLGWEWEVSSAIVCDTHRSVCNTHPFVAVVEIYVKISIADMCTH